MSILSFPSVTLGSCGMGPKIENAEFDPHVTGNRGKWNKCHCILKLYQMPPRRLTL
jgi:hypothetical protein